MKELLSEGLEKIFTLSYVFRDEPSSPRHRPQFLLLEWYRRRAHYLDLAQDCEGLVEKLTGTRPSIPKKSMDEIFLDILGIRITDFLEKRELRLLLQRDFPHLHLDSSFPYEWDDYFFLLFLNEVEPKLVAFPYLIIYEYPAPLCALATIEEGNPRVCERFEFFMGGVEMANAFGELTDVQEQRERAQRALARKRALYHYELPMPNILLGALEKGIGQSAGIALGVERLFGQLTGDNPFWGNPPAPIHSPNRNP